MLKQLKQKILQQEKGFTLIEVLVAILIMTTFTLVALEAMVLSAAFRVKARQTSDAATWIQEDLEQIRSSAAYYLATDKGTRCKGIDPVLKYPVPNLGYAAGLLTYIGDSPTVVNSVAAYKDILSKSFYRTRTTRVYGSLPTDGVTAPYNVVKVSYEVRPTLGGSTVAYFTTEVIPDESFTCPPF